MERLEAKEGENKYVSSKEKTCSGNLSGMGLMHIGRLQAVHSPCFTYFYVISHTAERITGTEGSQY